jgi:LacI family transcriptional regulator
MATGSPARKPTRHDVAVLAGVSDPVVTYTLTGAAPVAPETAARVRAAIAQLGYAPNQSARALRSGSARTLALVAAAGATRLFANPFFTEFAAAVEEAARARGCALLMASADAPDQPAVAARLRDLAARQVDGVLLMPGGDVDPAALDAIGVPWLHLNAPEPVPGTRTVGTDLRAAGREATRHLIEHGYRDIGFAGQVGEHRHLGWLDALGEAGLAPGPVLATEFSHEDGERSGRRLAAMPERPRAVFAASDQIAVGLLRALHEARLDIPADVAITAVDGSWEADFAWPAVTSLRQPIVRMAEASVARLLDPADAPGHVSFPGELIVRESCGAH